MQRSDDKNIGFIQEVRSCLEKAKLDNPLIKQNSIGNDAFFEEPSVGAKNIIPKICEAIKSAEREVLIIGYKIDKDCDGEEDLIAALNYLSIKARKENISIRVRIIINRKAGVAAYFKPNSRNESTIRNMTFSHLDYQYIEHNHSSFGSYHAKQFIVDGRLAILCSGDLTRQNNYKKDYEGLIEIGSVIHGKQITDYIRQDFISAWNSKTCNPVNETDKKKSIPESVFEIIDESEDFSPGPDEFCLKSYTHKKKHNESHHSTVLAIFINKHPVSVLYIAKPSSADILHQYDSPYKITVILAIRYAASTIDIMTPNFNDKDIINELVKAALRGVEINIVIGKHMNDSSESQPFMGGTNYENINLFIGEILQNGGQLDNVNIRFPTCDGRAIPESHPNSLHAKFICIDNELVIAGSSVLDLQSIYHSREADICFQSQIIAKDYKNKVFYPVFAKAIDYFEDQQNMINQVSDHDQPYTESISTVSIFLNRKPRKFDELDEPESAIDMHNTL